MTPTNERDLLVRRIDSWCPEPAFLDRSRQDRTQSLGPWSGDFGLLTKSGRRWLAVS